MLTAINSKIIADTIKPESSVKNIKSQQTRISLKDKIE
jgi:hypothetical protein